MLTLFTPGLLQCMLRRLACIQGWSATKERHEGNGTEEEDADRDRDEDEEE